MMFGRNRLKPTLEKAEPVAPSPVTPITNGDGLGADIENTLHRVMVAVHEQAPHIPISAELETRFAMGQKTLQIMQVEVQRTLNRLSEKLKMWPYFMIPDTCWNGDSGLFLLKFLEFDPFAPWNIRFLADDTRIALMSDTPVRPTGDVPSVTQTSVNLIAALHTEMKATHAETALTEEFGAFGDKVDRIKSDVKQLARDNSAELNRLWYARVRAGGGDNNLALI